MSNYSKRDIEAIIAKNKNRKSASKSPASPVPPEKSAMTNQRKSPIPRSISPKDLTLRYQQLCEKYKTLLEDVKDRNHEYHLQDTQLRRLKAEKQRDQKELFRLRSMIGFMKKEDKGVQVNMDMQSAGSWATKVEKSTESEILQDAIWQTPTKAYKQSKVREWASPRMKEMNKTASNLVGRQNSKKGEKNNEVWRVKADSMASSNQAQNSPKTCHALKYSQQYEQKMSKLSNSPYSKLRFTRKKDSFE